jgi:hypothetical protein
VLAAVALAVSWSPARGAELLANGGFEAGVDGWSTTFGSLEEVGTPVRSGGNAARLTSVALQSHEVYQWVEVAPSDSYRFGGWVHSADPAVERLFLRITWFDAQGSPVTAEDSEWLTSPADYYRWLNIGPVTSPVAAATARVGVRVQASSPFTVHLDDFSFSGAVPPPPTVAPTQSPGQLPTQRPTASPPPATTPKKTPTPSPSPAGPTELPEAEVFDTLTNPGFETLRADGTPYGWRDVGAELASVIAPSVDGERGLAVISRTGSTKWAYQTVRVVPGEWYEARGWAMAGDSAEAFVRLSWYATENGSGAAIDSVDSSELAGEAGGFSLLSTGPVRAPEEGRTVKFRLMVRPGGDGLSTAYFDALSLDPAEALPLGTASGPTTRASSRSSGARVAAAVTTGNDASPRTPNDGDSAIAATPFVFANVPRPEAVAPAGAAGGGSGDYRWLAYLGIAIGIAASGYAVATELARRRRD